MILSRIHSRTLSAAILLLVIPLLVAGCGGGVKPVIKLYDGQSESLSVNNAIFQFVAEEGYGYSVEVVVLDTLGMQNGLPSGEIDLNLEGWQQNIPDWYAQQLVQGTIVNLRMIYEGGPQFFIIPESVAEQSGINSVQDMADHWELFRDPQDPTKGVFYNCPIGSACNKMNEVKAGGLRARPVLQPSFAGIQRCIGGGPGKTSGERAGRLRLLSGAHCPYGSLRLARPGRALIFQCMPGQASRGG